jgi:tRNA pseudouridine55 synthase
MPSSRPIDGVLLLDKPIGITSNAAIQQVKRLLRAAKVGHVGTLDPLASGLLPICIGEGTKFSTSTFGADKRYNAEILLGITTTTGDTEGEVLARESVDVTQAQIIAALQRFTGNIKQTPPMYSALKRDGKPLYLYARAGESVPRVPRDITIHAITLIAFGAERLHIDVRCTKGTYIRVLAEDIGRVLGCGATLAGLRRVAVGAFDISQAVTLERFAMFDDEQRMACVLPLDILLSELPALQLDAAQKRRIQTGRTAAHPSLDISGLVRLYDQDQHFVGLATITAGVLVAKRLVASNNTESVGYADTSLPIPKID